MAAVLAEVQAKVPGVEIELAQLMEDLIGDLTAVPQPIEVKLYASDPASLIPQAEKVAAAISKIDGVVEVKSGVKLAGDALDLRIDPVRAGVEGVTPDDVSHAVDTALTGAVATQLPQTHEDCGRACAPARCTAASPDGPGRAADPRGGWSCVSLAARCHAGARDRPAGNLARQSSADDRRDRSYPGARHRCGRRRRAARPRPTGHTRLRRALRTWRVLSAAADRLCRAGSRLRGGAGRGVHPAAVPLRTFCGCQ